MIWKINWYIELKDRNNDITSTEIKSDSGGGKPHQYFEIYSE